MKQFVTFMGYDE